MEGQQQPSWNNSSPASARHALLRRASGSRSDDSSADSPGGANSHGMTTSSSTKRQRLDADTAAHREYLATGTSIILREYEASAISTEDATIRSHGPQQSENGTLPSGQFDTDRNVHRPLRRWNEQDFLAAYGSLSIDDKAPVTTQVSTPPSDVCGDISMASSSAPSPSADSQTSGGSPLPGDFRHLGNLYPMLSRDERQRLATLFTLTSGLEEDGELMDHIGLLSKLAPIATGYEIALVGLVTNSHYSQLAAKTEPRLRIPRREGLCSHTILNTPKGSIHSLPDLDNDWRFSGNPHVCGKGMKAYAGAPLLYEIPGLDISVPLGSLCVASFQPSKPLTEAQATELQRIARAIMHAITSVARRNQLARQTEMQKALMELKTSLEDPTSAAENIERILRKFYSTSKISFQSVADHRCIQLTGVDDVPYSAFLRNVWENDSLISRFINEKNHLDWTEDLSSCTVRAMAVKSGDQYIVVDTKDLRTFYDLNIDVMFVTHCALLLSNITQRVHLETAVNAKTAFLRDVQHSIRTSLNGILSASEMLLDEEERYQIIHSESYKRPSLERRATGLNAPSNLLSLIDSSGRQLLQVINQLLQLDRTSTKLKPLPEVVCIYDIEEEVLEAIMVATQRLKFNRVTLLSETLMSASRSNIQIDSSFLGHVIVAVLQNAVDVTEEGIVRITFDLSPDNNLVINIKDSGPGIPEALRAQIFEPFFKINGFGSTAGLGLTFARIYAEALGGSITIDNSSPAEGSLFRFQVPVKCRTTENKKRALTPATNTTYFVEDDTIVTRHYAETLDRLGYTSTTSMNARLIIQAEYRDQTEDSRPSTAGESVRIRIVAGNHYRKMTTTLHKSERLIRCGLPLGHNKIIASLRLVRDNFDGAVSDDVEALVSANTPAPSASLKSAGAAPFSMSLTNKRMGGHLRILNVDDNDINLRIISSFCSKRNYTCVNAHNGSEAVELYIKAHQEGQPLTFIAMDFQMPMCNGAEATKRIRAYEKEQNMPRAFIYMITGQSGEEEKHLSMQAGCDAYWVKPLRVRTLDDTLATLFM